MKKGNKKIRSQLFTAQKIKKYQPIKSITVDLPEQLTVVATNETNFKRLLSSFQDFSEVGPLNGDRESIFKFAVADEENTICITGNISQAISYFLIHRYITTDQSKAINEEIENKLTDNIINHLTCSANGTDSQKIQSNLDNFIDHLNEKLDIVKNNLAKRNIGNLNNKAQY